MGPPNKSSHASKTKRAGWQEFWREHFCRTFREDLCHFTHQFVSCLLSFPSHGKIRRPLQLSLTPTPTFHSWISLHLIRSGLHWTCITHCTTICAILTIDDLEGREACRSCSWLLTGARQRLAVRRLSSGRIPRCSRLCPWENGRNACVKHCFVVHLRSVSTHSSICFCFAASQVFNFFSSDRHFSSDKFSFSSS